MYSLSIKYKLINMVEFKEISFEKEPVNTVLEDTVYVVPFSGNPSDYCVISIYDEKELLQKGMAGEITFEVYDAVKDKITEHIKEQFIGKLEERQRFNNLGRSVIKSLCIITPVVMLLNMATFFFDDIFFDTIALLTFLRVIYLQKKERIILGGIKQKLNNFKVRSNPLLNRIYDLFLDLEKPGGDIRLLNPEDIFDGMTKKRAIKTLMAINSYLASASSKPRLWEWLVNKLTDVKLSRKLPQPAYQEIYKDVINKALYSDVAKID